MARGAGVQTRRHERARRHMLADLVTLGRHTVSARILAAGGGFRDWSADYRLYSRGRFDPEEVFAVVRGEFQRAAAPGAPLLAAIDDTILRKTGTRIPGVAYRRDPLSPPFRVNFARGLRVLQISALTPQSQGAPFRAVPIDFVQAPTPRKPSPKGPAAEWEAYRAAAKEANLSRLAHGRVRLLRERLEDPRPLWVVADGRLANRNFLLPLPENTAAIVRVRRDAKLHHPPLSQPDGAGRRRVYGPPAPTPDQLRADPDTPWQTVRVHAAGKDRDFRVKTVSPLRWRATSGLPLRLVVVAPLGYRLRKRSRVLYRQPAFLLCSDLEADPRAILEAYVARWDIEVNFRDEKTLLGAADPQVRNPASVDRAHALTVASYSLLLTAAIAAGAGTPGLDAPPEPKWRRPRAPSRPSARLLINQLRHELWSKAIRQNNFSHFTSRGTRGQKSEKSLPSLENSLFYACN